MTKDKNARDKLPGASSPTTTAAATSTATTIPPPNISAVSDFSLCGLPQPPSPLFPTSRTFSRDSTDSGFSSTATSTCPSTTTTPGPSTPLTARKGPSLSRAGSGVFRKGLSRQDSGCCDDDKFKGVPSIRSRTFQVWYLRGFQLAAPEMNASLVSEGCLPGPVLSNLARAAVAVASSAGAEASGKQTECVFTLGQPSTIDCRQDGLPHFSLTDVSREVLSLKVTRGTVKDNAGAVLVTRRAGDPADSVRCHWIEFSALELKIFIEFMADAFAMAAAAAAQAQGGGGGTSEVVPAGTGLDPAAPAAVSVGSRRRESIC